MQRLCSVRGRPLPLSPSASPAAAPLRLRRRTAVAMPPAGEPELAAAPLDWRRVVEVYDAAQASGAATKTDTQVHVFDDGGVPFVLRIASALRAKPRGAVGGGGGQPSQSPSPPSQQPPQQAPQQPRNPFLPYEQDLWVQHLSATHTLLLNKFNVVPHHVLVVTRAFESQADPLNAADLGAARRVLAAMPRGGVAFYNCGEHSGRSQPHKHVQVVPLPFNEGGGGGQQQQQQGCSSDPAAPPVQLLVHEAQAAAGAAPLEPFPVRSLPFRAYAAALEPSTTPEELQAAAAQLLQRCQAGLPAPVSYNVVLAPSFLLMVPRRQESAGGRIAINSLGFAGTVLLRSEEDLAYAKERRPLSMLAEVGQPWDTEH